MSKDEIEKYLHEHDYQYRWHKDYLFVKQLGVGFRIPLIEFKNANVPINIIIATYTNKPGNAVNELIKK